MLNEYKYKTAWCTVCNQGWVEFVKEEATGVLFLCCDECEATWDHPDDVNIREKGFRFKYGKVVEPNLVDILSKGWGKYILEE